MTTFNNDGSTQDFSNTVNPEDTTQTETDTSQSRQESNGNGISLKGETIQLGDVNIHKLDALIILLLAHWTYMAYKVNQ